MLINTGLPPFQLRTFSLLVEHGCEREERDHNLLNNCDMSSNEIPQELSVHQQRIAKLRKIKIDVLRSPQNRNSQETIKDVAPDYFKPKFQFEDRKTKEIHSHLAGLRFQTSKVGSDFIS